MAIGDHGKMPEDVPVDPSRLTWSGTGIGGCWEVTGTAGVTASGTTIQAWSGYHGNVHGYPVLARPVGSPGCCGAGSCPETHSIPNTPSQYQKTEEEYRLSCRNEQAIYDLLEHYESKGLRVYEVRGPAWLARVVRGMHAFDPHNHMNDLIGWIYGAAIKLDHKRDEKVLVIAWPTGNINCACLQ